MTYGKCISTSPYSPPLPLLPPTGLAYLFFPHTRLKDNTLGYAFDDRRELWTATEVECQLAALCCPPTPSEMLSGFVSRDENEGCDHYRAASKPNAKSNVNSCVLLNEPFGLLIHVLYILYYLSHVVSHPHKVSVICHVIRINKDNNTGFSRDSKKPTPRCSKETL